MADLLGDAVRHAFELLPDGIVIVRGDGSIVYASARAEELLGYEPGALTGKGIETLVPDGERAGHAANRAQYLLHPVVRQMGTPLSLAAQRADGTKVPVDIALSVWEGGPEPLVLAAIRDVTEARRLLDARVEAEERLQRLTDAADVLRASAELSPQDAMEESARLLAQAIGDASVVFLIDESGQWLVPKAFYHPDPDGLALLRVVLGGEPVRVGSGFAGGVAATGEPVVLGPIPMGQVRAGVAPQYWDYLDRFPLSCVLAVPLVVAGKVIGTVGLARNAPYTNADRELAEALAARIAFTFEHSVAIEGLRSAAIGPDLVFDHAAIGMTVADLEGRITKANQAFADFIGLDRDDLVGMLFAELTHPADRGIDQEVRKALRSGRVLRRAVTERFLRSDGSTVWGRVHVNVGMAGGIPVGYSAQVEDISEAKLATEALAAAESRFRLALRGAPTGMARVGLSGRLLEVNQVLCGMLSYREDQLVGLTLSDLAASGYPAPRLAHDEDADARPADEAADRPPGAGATTELRLVRSDGEQIWVLYSSALMRDEESAPMFYVSHFQDVTATRRVRDQLEYRARHDQLTGLLNRESGIEAVESVFGAAADTGRRHALLFCDIDNFKQINDTLGHVAGDQVLKEIGCRIASSVRHLDEVARVGGDEFIVVLRGIEQTRDAVSVAEKIRAAAAAPIRAGDRDAHPTVSVGVCVASADRGPDQVLRYADEALYQAKRDGRDRVCVVESDPEA